MKMFWIGFSIFLMTGCSYLHKSPPNLYFKGEIASLKNIEYGIIAFRYLVAPDIELSAIIKSVETGQWYSLKINQQIMRSDAVAYNHLIKLKQGLDSNITNPFLVMYALPPGKYIPVANKYYINKNDGAIFESMGDTIFVFKDSVTSFGTIAIGFKKGFYPPATINFNTVKQDIDSIIAITDMDDFNRLKISHQSFISNQK